MQLAIQTAASSAVSLDIYGELCSAWLSKGKAPADKPLGPATVWWVRAHFYKTTS